MRLTDYIAVLRRAWYLVALGAILGLVAGALAQYSRPAGYKGAVTVYANSDKADYVQVSQTQSLALQRMESYAALVGTTALGNQIKSDLSLSRSGKSIASGLTATLVKDTVLMKVTTTAPTHDQAEAIAGDVPTALNKVVGHLSSDAAAADANKVTFSTVTGPTTAKSRSLPALALSMLFGLLLGSALGAAIAILISRLRRRVGSPDDALAHTGLPVIGILPRVEGEGLGVRTSREDHDYWDANRRMGLNLQVLGSPARNRLVAVTSPTSRAESTPVARGLAAALASQGERVLLLDRMPERGERDGGSHASAATTFGMAELDTVAESPTRKGLFLAPAHATPTTPGEWRTLLAELSREGGYDHIIIDAPSVLHDVESTAVQLADSVVLVASQNSTRRDDVIIAAESLRAIGADNVAIVLRDVIRSSVPRSQMLSGLSLPQQESAPAAE